MDAGRAMKVVARHLDASATALQRNQELRALAQADRDGEWLVPPLSVTPDIGIAQSPGQRLSQFERPFSKIIRRSGLGLRSARASAAGDLAASETHWSRKHH